MPNGNSLKPCNGQKYLMQRFIPNRYFMPFGLPISPYRWTGNVMPIDAECYRVQTEYVATPLLLGFKSHIKIYTHKPNYNLYFNVKSKSKTLITDTT